MRGREEGGKRWEEGRGEVGRIEEGGGEVGGREEGGGKVCWGGGCCVTLKQ